MAEQRVGSSLSSEAITPSSMSLDTASIVVSSPIDATLPILPVGASSEGNGRSLAWVEL